MNAHAGPTAILRDFGNPGTVVRRSSGVEVARWGGPRSSGPPRGRAVAVPRVWGSVPPLRPSAGAPVAAFGYVPVPDDLACQAAAQRVRPAWGSGGEVAVGGAGWPVHGIV